MSADESSSAHCCYDSHSFITKSWVFSLLLYTELLHYTHNPAKCVLHANETTKRANKKLKKKKNRILCYLIAPFLVLNLFWIRTKRLRNNAYDEKRIRKKNQLKSIVTQASRILLRSRRWFGVFSSSTSFCSRRSAPSLAPSGDFRFVDNGALKSLSEKKNWKSKKVSDSSARVRAREDEEKKTRY